MNPRKLSRLAAVITFSASALLLSSGSAAADPDCINLPNTGTQLSCPPKGQPQRVPGVILEGSGGGSGFPSPGQLSCAKDLAQGALSALGPKCVKIGRGAICGQVPPPEMDARTCTGAVPQ